MISEQVKKMIKKAINELYTTTVSEVKLTKKEFKELQLLNKKLLKLIGVKV